MVDEHVLLQVLHVHDFLSIIHGVKSARLVHREPCEVFVFVRQSTALLGELSLQL